jgi:hypothetical protein
MSSRSPHSEGEFTELLKAFNQHECKYSGRLRFALVAVGITLPWLLIFGTAAAL